MSNRWTRWHILGAMAVGACTGTVLPGPSAAVNFVAVAPLCSTVLPVQFTIDGQLSATDTFRIDVSNPHTQSRNFRVVPGQHILGARVVGGLIWPDKTVTAVAGAAVADSLLFDCS